MKPLFYFDVDRKLIEECDDAELDEESLQQINMQIAQTHNEHEIIQLQKKLILDHMLRAGSSGANSGDAGQ